MMFPILVILVGTVFWKEGFFNSHEMFQQLPIR